MATTKTNIITHGYHGKVGNQFVFRTRGSKGIIAAKPNRENVIFSQAQKDQCKQFNSAVNYARAALQDPGQQEYYTSKATREKSAFNLAIADFLRKPCIDLIDATMYRGEIGDKILVIASDNAKITTARLSVLDEGGIELEGGPCLQDPVTTNWVYVASTSQAAVNGLTVMAVITDRPGHVCSQELEL